MFHICHDEIFAFMQLFPFLSQYVTRLRAFFHRNRPHPRCDERHNRVIDMICSNEGVVYALSCECGETFNYQPEKAETSGSNAEIDAERDTMRAVCPKCGAST